MAESNLAPETWAEALATYESDTTEIQRATEVRRRHQQFYAEQGIPATEVKKRYKESLMTEDARLELYAVEQVSRRALDLWSASSPEEFEQIMERAAATEAASGKVLDRLAGARAYSSAFAGARGEKSEQTPGDNPHAPGTEQHVQWAQGHRDGVDFNESFQAPKSNDAPKRQGRPKGSKNKPKVEASPESTPEPEPAEDIFASMPELPA
jgi:hypothetical protein